MKKFTYTVTGYSFSELDEKAKENVKNWYFDECGNFIATC